MQTQRRKPYKVQRTVRSRRIAKRYVTAAAAAAEGKIHAPQTIGHLITDSTSILQDIALCISVQPQLGASGRPIYLPDVTVDL